VEKKAVTNPGKVRQRGRSTDSPAQWVLGAAKAFVDRVDRLVYPRLIVPAVALLPAPVAYGVALLRADLRYTIERRKYPKEIARCLELVFGNQLSLKDRNRIARDFYRNESCQKIDAMRLFGGGRALLNLVEVRGLDHLKAALANGKGAVLCSGHLWSTKNSFSLIGALGIPVTLVARWSYDPPNNPSPIRKLAYRLDNGNPITFHLHNPNIRRSDIFAAVQGANVVRRNEVLGTLIDGGVIKEDSSNPISVDFLNGKALLVPGPATIAQLTGAPLFVMIMRRSPDWRHQLLEITPIRTDADTLSIFKDCLSLIESSIRRYPGQWKGWSLGELAILGLVSPDRAGLGQYTSQKIGPQETVGSSQRTEILSQRQ